MQMLFRNTCVVCHQDKLTFRTKKMILGITTTPESYCCKNCGSVFIEDELRWKLVEMRDKYNPIWQQFRQRSFYVREWLSIGDLENTVTA